MQRRLASALTVAAVLVLQLALGLASAVCTARMDGVVRLRGPGRPAGHESAQGHHAGMPACDDPAAQDNGPLDTAPAHDGGGPADCHALVAGCGPGFLVVVRPEAAAAERPIVHVAAAPAETPRSVTFAPEPPPPKA